MRLLRKLTALLWLFVIIGHVTATQSQDDDDDYDDDEGVHHVTFDDTPKPVVIKEFNTDLMNSPTPKVKIDWIEPQRGPITGETRVEVRGGPFGIWEVAYPRPLCKFGDNAPVAATYSTCNYDGTRISDKESRKKDRNFRCLACEFSPQVETQGPVAFQISLTGDFSDSVNSVEFFYYNQVYIDKIQPRYGPKDGGTPVKVWGKNFLSFNHTTRCAFGVVTVLADVKNDTYIECYSPFSDVVQKAMPFTITQNDQQFSRDTAYFWYYNWPSIKEIVPPRGPESGGTMIELKGRNFYPFREILDEVDNAPDVYCGFIDLKVRMPAIVYNSTRAECQSPPSYYWHQSRVELTLNSVDYTEDENIFYYYKPPILYDVDPREGPLHGGTNITVSGTGFENTKTIKCSIGDKISPGKFINTQQILCVAPEGTKPGYTPLKIAVQPDLWSSAVKYLYYETPIAASISPICGPDFGYTQIEVTGQNFLDLGTNKAMCVFNKTVFTNATIFNESLLYCDSPPLLNQQGYSLIGANGPTGDFYEFQLTMDGGVEIVTSGMRFYYYKQPQVIGVTPFGGVLKGQTPVTVNVTGLQQSNLCDIKVRFSTVEIEPEKLNSDQLQVRAPQASYPGTVVVQVAYNGQQYTDERVVHLKDPLASYEYYQEPLVNFHSPQQGPSTGGTRIKINGIGFKTFTTQEQADADHPQAQNRLWVRFVDARSKALIHEHELAADEFRNDEAVYTTIPQPENTLALMQISRNRVDWTDVKSPSPSVIQSFTYYPAPHVIKLQPSFGPVKPEEDTNVTIYGSNFVCPDSNCKNVKVRFTDNEGNAIFTSCQVQSSSSIVARLPKYTKPDVLEVEVSMNGVDFSNDNKTYGYYDPYVIDAQPRLISVKGSTVVTVTGLGFVDSGEVKTKFSNSTDALNCDGKNCTQVARFIDANTIETPTDAQGQMVYTSTGKALVWDPFKISVSVYEDQFTESNILLHYYREPKFGLLSSGETPANIPDELLISAEINPEDLDNILKYGKPKCRFTGAGHVMYTEGIFVHSSKAENGNFSSSAPNSIRCVTPVWNWGAQKIKLDLSLNGFDYTGDIDYTFGENLLLHRVVPMAGPISISTQTTRLLGQGFRRTDPKLEFESKWGPLETNPIKKTSVKDYKYYFAEWLVIDTDSEELKCYWYEAANQARVDSTLSDSNTYNMYPQSSPKLLNTTINQIKYNVGNGGPFYIEAGRSIEIDNYNMLEPLHKRRLQATGASGDASTATGVSRAASTASYIYYEFMPSAVEFYHYKQCTMVAMYPTHGLTRGGTPVQVTGMDFRYWPEWGVVPHCKFGDKIVRGYFDSSVRIVCDAPAVDEPIEGLSFEVSLNGVDWTSTGKTYSYYKEPVMSSYYPDSGQASGGTSIYIKGKNFPRMANAKEFNARFTPQSAKMGAKIMPVEWLNDTMVRVITPGGWDEGDKMDLQVTFNGQDYDENHFTFTFYNIASVKPRSGPSDGLGGDIIITGQGFRQDVKPLCRINGTIYPATSNTWTEIRCPMPAAEDGPEFFGNVDFSVSANEGADWHVFQGGFQYYLQPIVYDISPKTGPAHGIGVINFYGENFRADYALADLHCKIGNNIGVAVFVSVNQIRCVVEDMEQVGENQRLSAQVALNGYSWTATNDQPEESGSTFFVPYSVNAIFPNSGRVTGNTEVLIIGSGFVEDETYTPRCRFGTANNYAITEAQIISYHKMVCMSPPMPALNAMGSRSLASEFGESLPLEIPFSIAMTQDQFEPFTETHHRFRYYKSPVVSEITPNEVSVGLITEVLVTIDPSSGPSNVFFEPFPSEAGKFDLSNSGSDEASEVAAALLMGNHIKCKFGRFGETLAVFVNETSIKCVTPSVLDEPDDVYRELVTFSIAMNGYDYDFEVNSFDFTFVGTGSYFGLGPAILGILLVGVVLIAFILFTQNYYQSLSLSGSHNESRPNTVAYGDGVEHRGVHSGVMLRSQNNGSRGASVNDPNDRFSRQGANSLNQPQNNFLNY